MTQLPAWALRIQAVWLGLGVLLTVLAFQAGINVPQKFLELFNQETWDVLVQAATALFAAFQVIRSIIVASPRTAANVQALSNERVSAFAYNPFKLAA